MTHAAFAGRSGAVGSCAVTKAVDRVHRGGDAGFLAEGLSPVRPPAREAGQIPFQETARMTSTTLPVNPTSPSCGGHLVTADGRTLPLRSMRLLARAGGGQAAVTVVQTFTNGFDEPLQVRYLLPLPADAAVGGFAFTIGERRITGRIDTRGAARANFERALVEGRTAALLEQDRSALFTQELGNIPPGASITAEIEIDQPLQWTDGGWEWRFPTTVAPRYVGSEGRVADAGRIDVPVAAGALPPRLQVELQVDDTLVPGSAIRSPSHALRGEVLAHAAMIAIAEAPLDRDVVVRWQVAAPTVGVGLRVARPPANAAHAHEAYGLMTLVPPATIARPTPRDLIVLLDISGSMSGQPLAAAQAVTAALIRSLGADDRLELIAFASRPTPWLGAPCFATEGNKAAAVQWLQALRAGGGTEMRDAIVAALQPLRDGAQRQVVLVTDGQIGFEDEITAEIQNRLPASSRVHVVGVGSAPNRSLTRSAARAGAGIEVLIGLQDDPAPAAQRLLARTAAPVVTNLRIGGTALLGTCPQRLPDLVAGAPVRLGLRLRPEGGVFTVIGESATGAFRHDCAVLPVAAGSGEAALVRLVGREWVEDLEAGIAAGGDPARDGAAIERIGLAFGLATRATSWIAIDEQASVDPRAPRQVLEQPHELPHGMSLQALGLRPVHHAVLAAPQVLHEEAAVSLSMPRMAKPVPPAAPPAGAADKARGGLFDSLFGRRDSAKKAKDVGDAAPPPAAPRLEPPRPLAMLRTRDGHELVYDVLGLAHWSLPKRVVLVFADGREFVVEVIATKSTAPGAVGGSAVVRLVVRATAALPNERPRQLRLGEGPQAVVVDAA